MPARGGYFRSCTQGTLFHLDLEQPKYALQTLLVLVMGKERRAGAVAVTVH